MTKEDKELIESIKSDMQSINLKEFYSQQRYKQEYNQYKHECPTRMSEPDMSVYNCEDTNDIEENIEELFDKKMEDELQEEILSLQEKVHMSVPISRPNTDKYMIELWVTASHRANSVPEILVPEILEKKKEE